MDPFAIYEEHYKNLREAVSGVMYDNQIDALKEAMQVFECCFSDHQSIPRPPEVHVIMCTICNTPFAWLSFIDRVKIF